MNIKQFLLDNYIWILVIILITIVTIIGFLADKKRSGEKKEKKSSKKDQIPTTQVNQNVSPMGPSAMVNNQNEMQYQNINQQGTPVNPMNTQINNIPSVNMGNVPSNVTPPINPMDNTLNNNFQQPIIQEQPINQTMPGSSMINNSQSPVENIINTPPAEPTYQPLSEQTPKFAPQPIPDIIGQSVNQQPQPSVSNQMENNNYNMGNNNFNNTTIPQEASSIQPNMLETPANPYVAPMPNQPIPQMNPEINNPNYNNIPSYQSNNLSGTMPSPVNEIPSPIPVNPTHIVQPQPPISQSYNQPPMMEQTNIPTSIPNQNFNGVSESLISNNTPQQPPVNFVFGPQNNNQNM